MIHRKLARWSTLAALSLSLPTVFTAAPTHAAPPRVALQLIAEGFTSPMAFVPLPDGRALIVDQVGYIRLLTKEGKVMADPVFDATSRLSQLNHNAFDERGVLDLALHPKFSENRRVILSYTAPPRPGGPVGFECTLHISEFKLPAQEPLRLDSASEKVLLAIDHPYSNHNGGRLGFGPDGYLYVSVGDGGAANDQGKRPATGNGQNLDTLLGKILRIDVNAPDGRGIPADNPFADGKTARPEIYALGLRNPWGLSFDTGGDRALYVSDVGQTLYEEVNRITKGGNYGWFIREGLIGFDPKSPTKPREDAPKVGARGEPLLDPIAVYKNVNGFRKDADAYGISVTGGYIYRGKALPELEGHYVYGDWSRNWGLPQGQLLVARRSSDPNVAWKVEPIELASPAKLGGYLVSFGRDNDGELYVMTNSSNSLRPGTGKLWKIVPAAP